MPKNHKMDCPKTSIFKHVLVDNGLVSLIDMETGVSSISMNNIHNHHLYHFVSRPGLKNISWVSFSSSVSTLSSSPRSPRSIVGPFIVSGGFLEKPKESHFLDYCFLCKKQIGVNKDIFMYRGDTPFCSEECRQEQIEMDEAVEKSRNLSASVKAMRKKEQIKSNCTSTKTNQNCTFHSSRMMLLPDAKKPIIF